MDRIEFAERRFQQILPAPASRWEVARNRDIATWLRDDVGAVVADFLDRPSFRAHAAWPLRRLVSGSEATERRDVEAVEAVDAALVTSARALVQLADIAAVARALIDLNPPRHQLVPQWVVIGDLGPPERYEPIPLRDEVIDGLSLPWEQARTIAGRAWTDLVCPQDYLGPRGGMMLKAPAPPGVTEGEFVVALNPELHPVGDFVTRCMIRRIEVWQRCLEEFRRLCYAAWGRAGRPEPDRAESERIAWTELQARIANLRAMCLDCPAAALRDSCIILTQVYAIYHPVPDLAWLRPPDNLLEDGTGSLRHRITGAFTSEPIERIATAVGDLRRLPDGGPPRRAPVDAAIAAGGLVLVDRPRSAFWDKQRFDADWDRHAKAWEFLHALAAKARIAAAVDERDLYAEPMSESTMANRFRRLKPLLPPRLRGRIVPAGLRSYRLDLDCGQVHLFDAE